jgi:hypothetical protein
LFANASVPPDGRTQYFTFGSVVAVINSVIGGSAVAIALRASSMGGVEALFPSPRRTDETRHERRGRLLQQP